MNQIKSLSLQGAWKRILYFYSLAICTVAATTLILLAFRGQLDTSVIALLYLLPVLVSTTLWGLGPGILSAFTGFLSFNYFFIPPYFTFLVHRTQDIIALAIFLVVAILISQLVGSARKGMETAVAREQESTRLYELSVGLSWVNDLKEIASVISQKMEEVFQADLIMVDLEALPGDEPVTVVTGRQDIEKTMSPTAIAPLETGRVSLGKIRLWREGSPISDSEKRLLYTFTAQGALAMERSRLAHAEAHAKLLQESDRLKSSLLSSVSHEFRTPLSTIKAAITSLLSEQVEWDREASRELLVAVNEETDHLNRLVGNLLDMSKIESGVLKPNRQWNLLPEIIDGVIERMQPNLARHRVRVVLPEELPLVPVDYLMLEQVFMNLLSNGAKYAPQGTEILVQAMFSEPDMLLVQVTNQGPPVAPEHLDHIFDKFFRVTNAEKVSGTGLGLSICKGIIEAHEGKIWAANLPEGFSILFTLPLLLEGEAPPVIESGL